jgi:uncharacterized SAM-binding protein YcdF (DUF218 family)
MDAANASTDDLARIVWDYHRMGQRLVKSDCILVLGSNDLRVAEHGARLLLEGWAPLIVLSGGSAHHDDILATNWGIPEARRFAEVAIALGVDREKILIEDRSTNTGENLLFSWELLRAHGLSPTSFTIVQKPYMERRAYATMRRHWPEKQAVISSPPLSFEEYCSPLLPKDVIIHTMVGDLQRIKEYPKRGYQIEQHIPAEVWSAYEELVRRGFTQHLIRS